MGRGRAPSVFPASLSHTVTLSTWELLEMNIHNVPFPRPPPPPKRAEQSGAFPL